MSFEGYTQNLCPAGHYWNNSYLDPGNTCIVCGSAPAWTNLVDDTNCDLRNHIDTQKLLKSPPTYEECSLGHQHIKEVQIYRIPDEQETQKLREEGNAERARNLGY